MARGESKKIFRVEVESGSEIVRKWCESFEKRAKVVPKWFESGAKLKKNIYI